MNYQRRLWLVLTAAVWLMAPGWSSGQSDDESTRIPPPTTFNR